MRGHHQRRRRREYRNGRWQNASSSGGGTRLSCPGSGSRRRSSSGVDRRPIEVLINQQIHHEPRSVPVEYAASPASQRHEPGLGEYFCYFMAGFLGGIVLFDDD